MATRCCCPPESCAKRLPAGQAFRRFLQRIPADDKVRDQVDQQEGPQWQILRMLYDRRRNQQRSPVR